MKVFLSWSGARSKAVAGALAWWLPQTIQAVEPWISSDMDKGARWSPEIASQLEATRVGIVCLTRDNLAAPWLVFEAGALSKTKDAYVCTFLLDVTAADVEPPLGQFQHTLFEKGDVRRLLETINKDVHKGGERGLSDTALSDSFDMWWPKLEQRLRAVQPSATARTKRPERELLEEVLEIVRGLQRPSASPSPSAGSPSEWPAFRIKGSTVISVQEVKAVLKDAFPDGLVVQGNTADPDHWVLVVAREEGIDLEDVRRAVGPAAPDLAIRPATLLARNK
jgi:hypothetical protein